jgi:uncharacterized protein YPO0396
MAFTLFDQTASPKKMGFHLQLLQVYNWGTFGENKIWSLKPDGHTSLLTGSNGSGKTTLVDALVSLLVPPTQRHYNQSSGAERKRERNEQSYVRGAFGAKQQGDGYSAQTTFLRDTQTYSLLLAQFADEALEEVWTIAQLRYFSKHNLKRVYIIAPHALFLDEHFHIDQTHSWRRELRDTYQAEITESFPKYTASLKKHFGMRSDKAFTLFGQTVGVKVLGNLNEFMRSSMLEPGSAETRFQALRQHYMNLLEVHNAIELATKRLELLEPIHKQGKKYRKAQATIAQLEETKSLIPAYFAQHGLELFSKVLQQQTEQLGHIEDKLAERKQQQQAVEEQRKRLHQSIARDEVQTQLNELDHQLHAQKAELGRREKAAKRYREICQKLGLQADISEALFTQNRTETEQRQQTLQAEKISLEDELLQHRQENIEIDQELDAVQAELASLKNRRTNIPLQNVQIRQRITDALDLPPDELPFAGELLKVHEEEEKWQPAIERLVHSFALRLLVPERHYERVNEFAHRHNLKGRLVYERVLRPQPDFLPAQRSPQQVSGKLVVKPDHALGIWLEERLGKQFNYLCTDDLEVFRRTPKALTSTGLIKDHRRHEKDDRPGRWGKDRYVLGWENKEKIHLLTRQQEALANKHTEVKKHIEGLRNRRQKIEEEAQDCIRLLDFRHFPELDIVPVKENIDDLEQKKQALLQASDHLRMLEQQLQQANITLDQLRESETKLEIQKATLQQKQNDYQRTYEEQAQTLAMFQEEELAKITELSGLLGTPPHNITAWEKGRNSARYLLDDQLKAARQKLEDEKGALESRMVRFYRPSPKLLERFPQWHSGAHDLGLGANYLDDYDKRYTAILQDELPEHRERFRQWFNDHIILDLINFRQTLENQLEDIHERVAELNSSLYDIDFSTSPVTYIRLKATEVRRGAIQDFRHQLRHVLPNARVLAERDSQELDAAFHRVRELIERLSEDEPWRKRVTDVRNWLEFAGEECYRADDTQHQYYADSQSLSGGEKAKLAYTILASALVFQFGIKKTNARHRSFRFAIVDEAFSKIDHENSVYALELFRRLNLQLMVVTPLDRLHIVEPYVKAVHFTNKKENYSNVINLTMKKFKELMEEETPQPHDYSQ